MDLSSFI